MSQGITFDIRARVTGYEDSLAQMKRAFEKIEPGSEIGKKLSKAISEAEDRLKGLNKNLTPHATSNTQLDSIIEKTNATGEALQRVAQLMQSVNGKDLKLSAMGGEVDSLLKQIQALESQISTSIDSGLRVSLQQAQGDAQNLKAIFESLGVNLDTITQASGLSALNEGLRAAQQEASKAETALDKINEKLVKQQTDFSRKYDNNPLAKQGFNQDDFTARLLAITGPEKILNPERIQELQSRLLEVVSNTDLKGKDNLAQRMLENLFQNVNPTNLKNELNDFVAQFAKEFNIAKTSIQTQIFGQKGDATASFVNSYLMTDPEQLKNAQLSLQNLLKEVVDGLKPEQVGKLTTLVNGSDIKKAKEVTLQEVISAYTEIRRQMSKELEEINNLTQQAQIAEGAKAAADQRVSNLSTGIDQYTKQIAVLENKVAAQEQTIADLRKQVEALTESKAANIRSDSAKGGIDASAFQISAAEAAKYQQQLDQVHAKEKLVGKIEGVVQRWFSIYAAVRMVSNAVRSVISTIKELDKTITEIAIVTNMTQSQLWDQMSDYTAMARQYAASISGVYQVSQLYYQQGISNI